MKKCFAFACFLLFGCAEKREEPAVTPPPPPPTLVEDISKDLSAEWASDLENFQLQEIDGVQEICNKIKVMDFTFVSPGSGVTREDYLTISSLAKKYNIEIPECALENHDVFHCADSKEKRLKNFNDAVNSEHELIWAIRGGFGSSLLIEDLNKMPVPPKKKTFIGFSDATSLNIFLSQKWGWRVVHAPVLIHLNNYKFSVQNFHALIKVLEGTVDKYRIPEVYPLNHIAQKTKEVQGRITGGNLTIVENSLGTCWEIDTKDKILFVEDCYISSWRIYRSLYHLKEYGKLNDIKALILCRFAGCGPQKEIVKTLTHFAESLNIPVYLTDQIGHGNHNMPIVYNSIATLHEKSLDIDLRDLDDQKVQPPSETDEIQNKEEIQKTNGEDITIT